MLKICVLAAIAIIVASTPVRKDPFRLCGGQSQFTVSVMMTLMKDNPETNIFFSSHSSYRALLLAYMGSTGATEQALKKHLFLDWANDKTNVANAYKFEWLTKQVRTAARVGKAVRFNSVDKLYLANSVQLKSNITELFGNDIETVDFTDPEARRVEINAFIQKEAHKSMKNFLPTGSVDTTTNGILINAAFFKGFWENAFDRTQTENMPFGNGGKMVPMMSVKGQFKFGVFATPTVQMGVVEIPYHGNLANSPDKAISMFVYLPLGGDEAAFGPIFGQLIDAVMQLEMPTTEMEIKFPKISIQSEYILKDVLKSMGVEDLFENGNLGDFGENVSLDDIIHKGVIRFDEDGATVATSVADTATTEPSKTPKTVKKPDPVTFFCDKPFIFSINDRIFHEVLFAGVYRGPN